MWERIAAWSNDSGVWLAMTSISAVLFTASLIAIPIVCIRLPTDYFVRLPPRRARWKVVLRAVIATVLIVTGLAMLVLPGQGLLTILLGLSLLDFPAKRAWQRRLLQRPSVLRPINGVRRRAGKPALRVDPPEA